MHIRVIFLEKLWKIEILSSFIRLLVEINGADTILKILDVRSNTNNKIIAAHIAQQPYKTPLVEFDKLLGQPDLVGQWLIELFDKEIAGYAGYMFFDQCIITGKKYYP